MADQPRNIDGKSVPEHLWRVAEAIQPVLRSPKALTCWREKIVEWAQPRALESVQITAGEYFPLQLDLPLLDQFAVLGAAYDAVLGSVAGVEHVEPAESRNETLEVIWIRFSVLKLHCLRDSIGQDESRLVAFLEGVKAAIGFKETSAVRSEVGTDSSKRRKTKSEYSLAEDKLISLLSKHHGYENGRCSNAEPIGNNQLAEMAEVAASTASDFFARRFKGYKQYRFTCGRDGALDAILMVLNREVPSRLLNRPAEVKSRRSDDS